MTHAEIESKTFPPTSVTFQLFLRPASALAAGNAVRAKRTSTLARVTALRLATLARLGHAKAVGKPALAPRDTVRVEGAVAPAIIAALRLIAAASAARHGDTAQTAQYSGLRRRRRRRRCSRRFHSSGPGRTATPGAHIDIPQTAFQRPTSLSPNRGRALDLMCPSATTT